VRKRCGLDDSVDAFIYRVDVGGFVYRVDVGGFVYYLDIGGSTAINGGAYAIGGCVVLPAH
jgi:hypothetical protein